MSMCQPLHVIALLFVEGVIMFIIDVKERDREGMRGRARKTNGKVEYFASYEFLWQLLS